MLTEAELKEVMAVIHGIVKWRATTDPLEHDDEYEEACQALHTAVDGLSETAIAKLISLVNMRTMKGA